jgi:RNA polymerase sigma factor (sigma-70 family)
MAHANLASVATVVRHLFDEGSLTGLADGALLDRFVRADDELAFETLLARHGPLVRGVCRRMLVDPAAADDAFQATFLILVRKAAALRHAESIGPWLFGVARRVSLRARRDLARDQSRLRRHAMALNVPDPDPPNHSLEIDALREKLDDELAKLPERQRAPIILCYLQGLTHDEAAKRLRWPVGTVRSRLARGRDTLRQRLSRSGAAITTTACLSVLAAENARAATAVPETLARATLDSARAVVSASSLSNAALAPHIASWTRGVLTNMTLSELKIPAALLAASCIVAGGAYGFAVRADGGAAPAAATPNPQAQIQRRDDVIRSLEKHVADLERQLDELKKRDAGQADQPEDSKVPLTRRRAPAGGGAAAAGAPEGGLGGGMNIGGNVAQPGGMRGMMSRGAMNSTGRGAAPGGGQLGGARGAMMPDEGGGMMSAMDGMGSMMSGMRGREPSPSSKYLQTPEAIILPTANNSAFIGYSVETGKVAEYKLPNNLKAVPIAAFSVVALDYNGDRIPEIAAFSPSIGEWAKFPLQPPAEGTLSPIVAGSLACYVSGNAVYAYSAEAGRWDRLNVKQPENGQPIQPAVQANLITVSEGDNLHIFSAKTGRWTTIRTSGSPEDDK